MNLFDTLVDSAIDAQPALASVRPVVEKEILHHDILREMSAAGLLESLTFIGGTCLRDCYGSDRLSEDLDFTGGLNFLNDDLSDLAKTIVSGIHQKYGLDVSVSEPFKETGNVDTWKIKVITNPGKAHLPAQRINIDVCAVPSHDRRPAMLRNHYPVDMGTSGLILLAESREEILADKVVALALRPNRIKNRDLWDILWLTRQGLTADSRLVLTKLDERRVPRHDFLNLLQDRVAALAAGYADYVFEIRRFIAKTDHLKAIDHPGYWDVLLTALRAVLVQLQRDFG